MAAAPFRNHFDAAKGVRMTTPTTMSESQVIDQLNELIENCSDGAQGFHACAEHARAPELKQVLDEHALQCAEAARQLQGEVRRRGAEPHDRGTAGGAVHRGWVAVRSKLTGYTDLALLEECERGEDVALKRYRDALEWPLPADLRPLVERQYQGARRNHDQVKLLRERYRAAG